MINHLPEVDKQMIDYLRRTAIESTTSFNESTYMSTEDWLRPWAYNKDSIYTAFNNNFILTRNVDTVIETDELYNTMRKKLMQSYELVDFEMKLTELIDEYNEPITDKNLFYTDTTTLYTNTKFSELIRYNLFSLDNFITNNYSGDSIEVKTPSGVFKLVHGAKLMRALSRLAKAFNIESRFEPIRLLQSQIMNEAHIKADIHLSIHPLDYMTASFNNNDWRSCMHWLDGEYRRGVVEMMNSPIVIVAYIDSKHETLDFGYHKWNSKKWREFFIVNNDVIAGIKGYPYWNRELEDFCLRWLKEIFDPNENFFPTIYELSSREHFTINIEDTPYHLDFNCGPAMYNDFQYTHHMYISKSFHERHPKHDKAFIDYSGDSECINCGSTTESFETEGELMCDACLPAYTCCHCGERITDIEDDLVEINGRYYHQDCTCDVPTCDICGSNFVDLDADPDDGVKFVVYKDDPNQILYTKQSDRPVGFLSCNCCKDKYLDENLKYVRPRYFFNDTYNMANYNNLPEYFIDNYVTPDIEDDYNQFKNLVNKDWIIH